MDDQMTTPEPQATVSATATAVQENIITDDMIVELMTQPKEKLVEWLDKYGYVAEPETSKKELIKAILELHRKQIMDSEELVKKSTAEIVTDRDPLVVMTFMSLESPGASYEFTYAGPNGFKLNSRGEALPAPKWHLYHNRSYTVPYSVVKHLNSLKVQADTHVQTDTQGFIQNLYSGETNRQPRFSCIINLTPEQEQGIIQKG